MHMLKHTLVYILIGILKAAGGRNHVMNLGHGIDAQTPEPKAKFFVDTVQAWKK